MAEAFGFSKNIVASFSAGIRKSQEICRASSIELQPTYCGLQNQQNFVIYKSKFFFPEGKYWMYAKYFLYFCQVKVLRLILTIYFIALLVMPCSDVKAQSSVTSSSQISINTSDSHSDESDDSCSPLCFCSCCQINMTGFNIEPLVQLPAPINVYFSKKILFHKNNISYKVYDHIWQPPKI